MLLVVGMQPELHVVVDSITKWELQRCIQQWERHWALFINCKGKVQCIQMGQYQLVIKSSTAISLV